MKRLLLFLLSSLLVFALCGCGEKKYDVSSFDVKVGGRTVKSMKIDEWYHLRDNKVTHTVNYKDHYAGKKLTIGGLTVGNTVDDIIKAYDLKPGYALLDYEYDPYGDGCTDVDTCVYDGTIPSFEELSILDLDITMFYHYKDGAWFPVDLNKHEIEDYGFILSIDFDIEGVHNLYGVKKGEAYSCEFMISQGE